MNAERLKQIEEIYHAALKIKPDTRESFFNEFCGTDEDLRREVESLLLFENTSDDFLDASPAAFAAEMFAEKEKQTDLTDTEIGRYKIIKLLGAGGMGEVYLAEDARLRRRLALKLLPADVASNEQRLRRFEQEALSASALNHPNILTIYEFGADGDVNFLAAEFVEGETLGERLRRGGGLAVDEALEIAIQTAEALSAAHRAGIIHRDIKPENIMIRADGIVKVLDFGLAKLVGFGISDLPIEESETLIMESSENPQSAIPNPKLTNPGVIMGTADYMSPEQARAKATDARTDVFSLGVVIYEMLTGQKPFHGETVNHTIVNILEKEPKPISAFCKDCPAEFERIINKSLTKNADERYTSAEDLLKNLKKMQKRLEFEAELRKDDETLIQSDAESVTLIQPLSVSEFHRRSISAKTPNNLTENLPPIIGRAKEIGEITDLLKSDDVRLLTMTGIGGTGKTRLARAIARQMLEEFPDGVFFVGLTAISDYNLVASEIAQPLGVKESGGEGILDALKNHLGDKKILLVVDNFEQVTQAAPVIAELLETAANLKILITSRVVLHLSAEQEYIVPPLAVPSASAGVSFAETANFEAVKFFAERARYAQRDFVLTEKNADSVAEICRRLDGLPLAIELAAARVKLFTPAALLKRLEKSLNLLTGGAKDLPERQQTMRGAIQWSYDLLEENEKRMFNRLAVFRGGFTLDAVESVVSGQSSVTEKNKKQQTTGDGQMTTDIFDEMSSLLEKSLIVRSDGADGEPRFRLLVVVREFALEKLAESGEADEIKQLHAELFADLADKFRKDKLKAPELFEKFEQEHDNTRAALEWSLENEMNIALRLAVGGYMFWLRRGYLAEGVNWMKAALAKNAENADVKLLAEANRKIAYLFRHQGNYKEAVFYGEEGLRLCRQIGDKQMICIALGILGAIKGSIEDFKSAKELLEESLAIAKETNDQRQIGQMFNSLGEIARGEKDYQSARKYYEESRIIAKQLEHDESHYPTINLASITYLAGDYEYSRRYSLEALEISLEFGDKVVICLAIANLAALAMKAGKPEKAALLSGAAAKIQEATSYKPGKVDQDFINRYTEETRTQIGDEAFDATYAEGRTMSLEQAIAFAREENESDPAQITDDAQKRGATGFQNAAHQTADTLAEIPASSTEHAVIKAKKQKFVWFAATAIFIAALIAIAYFAYF